MSRRPMSRRRTIAIGSLALVLLGAPFLPDGDTPPALETSSAPGPSLTDATAGEGAVTPAMRQEIDAVLAEGRTAARTTAGTRLRPAALVRSQVRCADFEGQRYCLNAGWTDSTEDEVVADLAGNATSESARSAYREETGDLSLTAQLRQRAALGPAARATADRAELTEAARSVAKVWLLRHQIQGVALPDGFLARHPEVRTRTATGTTTARLSTTTPTATARKSFARLPGSARILRNDEVAEQTRTYWCGPTSMQMIAWGWSHQQRSQQYWANRLGTTSQGTSISAMVDVDQPQHGLGPRAYAGKYIVLDIKKWSYRQWYVLQMRHTVDYRAPVILHPILLKKWYPYLDDDASGHFQVGRGYNKNGDRPNLLRYFEPWNQQRFDRSEPYIERRQLKSAYRATGRTRSTSSTTSGSDAPPVRRDGSADPGPGARGRLLGRRRHLRERDGLHLPGHGRHVGGDLGRTHADGPFGHPEPTDTGTAIPTTKLLDWHSLGKPGRDTVVRSPEWTVTVPDSGAEARLVGPGRNGDRGGRPGTPDHRRVPRRRARGDRRPGRAGDPPADDHHDRARDVHPRGGALAAARSRRTGRVRRRHADVRRLPPGRQGLLPGDVRRHRPAAARRATAPRRARASRTPPSPPAGSA